jgi:hypothetical protein
MGDLPDRVSLMDTRKRREDPEKCEATWSRCVLLDCTRSPMWRRARNLNWMLFVKVNG